MINYYTHETNFFGNTSPQKLIEQYGSPLYVYNESILRAKCREMQWLVSYPYFTVNYACKANSNLEVLRIIRQEGLHADAISPGEVHVLLAAGYQPNEIFYISNNISEQEMMFVIEKDILMSVDSISQLKQYGRINPGGKIAVRLNPGIGAGHHQKVITAGENTKFGIDLELIPQIKNILKEYNLKLVGINHHIGSLFMDGTIFLEGAKYLLHAAEQFDDLEFIDIGGGFGIPYQKQKNESPLELIEFGQQLTELMNNWSDRYGKKVLFKIEPGRYIVAECGILLGTVYSIKQNHGTTYVGTDLGFNALARPILYDSYHDIEIYKKEGLINPNITNIVNVVGNICESGDIIAQNRALPPIDEKDLIGVMDAGAYGYSMASNYNNRLRPAEVLLKSDGSHILIRRRDTLDDLMSNFIVSNPILSR